MRYGARVGGELASGATAPASNGAWHAYLHATAQPRPRLLFATLTPIPALHPGDHRVPPPCRDQARPRRHGRVPRVRARTAGPHAATATATATATAAPVPQLLRCPMTRHATTNPLHAMANPLHAVPHAHPHPRPYPHPRSRPHLFTLTLDPSFCAQCTDAVKGPHPILPYKVPHTPTCHLRPVPGDHLPSTG
jgi:hypothetical protein